MQTVTINALNFMSEGNETLTEVTITSKSNLVPTIFYVSLNNQQVGYEALVPAKKIRSRTHESTIKFNIPLLYGDDIAILAKMVGKVELKTVTRYPDGKSEKWKTWKLAGSVPNWVGTGTTITLVAAANAEILFDAIITDWNPSTGIVKVDSDAPPVNWNYNTWFMAPKEPPLAQLIDVQWRVTVAEAPMPLPDIEYPPAAPNCPKKRRRIMM